MKINKKFLSVPPYLSTSWEHIAAIRLDHTDLVVTLTDGVSVTIPNLVAVDIESIFNYHLNYLESHAEKISSALPETMQTSLTGNLGESIFKMGVQSPENMNIAMQHEPRLTDAPDIPPEVLQKISAISKIISPEDVLLPKAEPHCNCPYCQISRAIFNEDATTHLTPVEMVEEEVKEEDLTFQEWEISQSGDRLFNVVNKLDSHEKYSVYLGHPVGCTCGKEGCEHILAVLKS